MAMQTNRPRRSGADATRSGSGDPREKAQEMAGQAQEKAQEMGGQAQEKAQEMAGQAREKAQEMAGKAQESSQAAAGQVQSRLREQLDQRSTQAAEQINSQAADLRTVGDSLREQGKDGPAQAAERLAQYGERVGGYLQDKDSDALLSDAEEFARRQPWVVAAGGFVLGFAASRFLKASSSKRYSSRSEGTRSATLPQRAGAQALAVPDAPRSPAVPPVVAGEPVVGSMPDVPPRRSAELPQDAPANPPTSPRRGAES